VDGWERSKSFPGRPLADAFLTSLKDVVRDGRPFNPHSGLPEAGTTGGEAITLYAYARAYTGAKWPHLAPVSRRSVAEAPVPVTITARRAGYGVAVLLEIYAHCIDGQADAALHTPPP
jgi:hypothetical protein